MNTYHFSVCDKYGKSRITMTYLKKIFGITVSRKEVGDVPKESPFIGSLFHRIEDTNEGPVSLSFNSGKEMNRVLSAFAYMACSAEPESAHAEERAVPKQKPSEAKTARRTAPKKKKGPPSAPAQFS